ncbi:MAG TPA: hypothetical protein HA326_07685 [Thermoplasmata archaeon]|nr:hypothetical protein [Thermoplasmata archaeon]
MAVPAEYDQVWEMLATTHRKLHGDHKPPVGDMNCCPEYALMMALRAASTLRDDYPAYLLRRASALPDLDQEFYVENILSTDGETPPADPEALREYRAARRHHILWNELKTAAARIEELEARLERPG